MDFNGESEQNLLHFSNIMHRVNWFEGYFYPKLYFLPDSIDIILCVKPKISITHEK